MSPVVAESDAVEAPAGAPAPIMQLNEPTRTLFHLLETAFGGTWEVNEDPRYIEELIGAGAIVDVTLPVDQHEEAVAKAMDIELRMLKDFRVHVTILVVAPAEVE